MNQRKVSTRTNDFNLKARKIMDVMVAFPEGITPKELGRLTGLNTNTIKSILPKLENIKKVMRGVYKVYEWGDSPQSTHFSDLRSWNFHNCHLSSVLSNYPGRLIETTHSLNLLNLKFIINNQGKASLSVSSDFPLNVSSICLVAGYFKEQISKYSDSSPSFKDIMVSTIEFNKDYSNLRLDGVKCITLDNLTEQFKVYQKKIGVRIEHKTKIKFNVENIVDMLSSNPNSLELNLKLSKQKEQLDRLSLAMSNNTQLMFKLMDQLKSG